MKSRIALPWWPLLAVASPILVPLLVLKNIRYRKNLQKVARINEDRINRAQPLALPDIDSLALTVLVEEKKLNGFLGEPGVSYLFKSERGSLLYDVGYGPERKTLGHNARKLGIGLDEIDALAISHLHPDHMGGMKASWKKTVAVSRELGEPSGQNCYLPDRAEAPGFNPVIVTDPQLLASGIGTTGPLSRSLFMLGYTEEQAIVAKLKGRGLVVFTGCGHPTIEVILRMVRKLSTDPIYAIGGGLHFPITAGRENIAGIHVEMLVGTGLPPWRRLTDDDLGRTIAAINDAAPKFVYLSAHDTCDHALRRFEDELNADAVVLQAGETYDM